MVAQRLHRLGPLLQPALGLLASLLLPLSAQGAEVLPPDARVERLESGLTVVVVPLQGAELVAVQTWVAVGSRDEILPGTTGYAHFFEHLMFLGSEQVSAEEREQRLLRMGAVDNAWTSDDHTCYHLVARAAHLPEILALEADRFQALRLTPDAVRREAGAVMGELRKDRSDPDSVLYERLYATAFTTHTYHHTPIGLEEDVLGMADGYPIAQAFYAAHYRPENLTLVITGGVTPDAALAAVREAYGGWQPAPLARPALPVEPPQTAERRAQVAWTGGGSARLAVGWKAPAFDPAAREAAALSLVYTLLTAPAAPLYRRLIEEEELAWSMWSEAPERRDPSLLALFIELRDGVVPATVEAAVAEEVAALQQATEAQVSAARDRARRALLLSLDDPEAWAATLGWYGALGGGPEALEQHLDALARVTVEDVRAAAATLTPARRTVVTLLPVESAP